MSASRRHHCCGEFTRAELARRSLAEAGSGLPAIEPGMPAPAGTGLNRRSFLLRSGALALSVYGASLLRPQAFTEGIAKAAGSQGKVLVSVFLDGGIDALSVLAPVDDADYRRLRPQLRLPPGAGPTWSEDSRLQWHPSAAPLHKLHGEGKVTVFPGIGYAGADQSHFTSRHYWEVGELSAHANTGWLGRLLDVVGDDENPLQGLSLDGALAPSLATARVPVAATWGAGYDLFAPGVWGDVEELMFESFARMGATAERSRDRRLRGAGKVVRQASSLREQLGAFSDDIPSPVPYPDTGHFPESLAGLAAMLGAGLPITVASVERPRRLRHPRRAGRGTGHESRRDLRRPARLPARPRGPRHRRPRRHARLVGVRPAPRGERLRRHRPRRRRQRVSDRQPRSRPDGRRVAGSQGSRRGRQPALDRRLPFPLLRAARAVVRRRRSRRDPRRRRLPPTGADRMIRRLASAALLLALAGPIASAAAAPAAEPPPSRLLVTAREYSLTLSRAKLRAGPAIVQLYNFGEDPHDLNLRRIGADRVREIGDVEPGDTGSLEAEAAPQVALPALVRDPDPREPRHGGDAADEGEAAGPPPPPLRRAAPRARRLSRPGPCR